MKSQRLAALGLLVIAAATMVLVSKMWVYPACICLAGLVGVKGSVKTHLSPVRRLIAFLLVGSIFAFLFRMGVYEGAQDIGYIEFDLAYGVAQFVLMIMVLQFFLDAPNGMERGMVLMGLGVMLLMGNVIFESPDDNRYHIMVIAYILMAVIFSSASRKAVAHARAKTISPKRALVLVLLVLVVISGVMSSKLLYRHQAEANDLLQQITFLPANAANMSFSGKGKLGGISQLKQYDSDSPALHVFCEQSPGYMRGKVLELYSNSSWRDTGKSIDIPRGEVPAGLEYPENVNTFLLSRQETGKWKTMEVWPRQQLAKWMFAPIGTTVLHGSIDNLKLLPDGTASSPELMEYAKYSLAAPIGKSSDGRSFSSVAYLGTKDQPPAKIYTQLPAKLDSRIKQIAKNIFAMCQTDAEKIHAVEQYFRDNYKYYIGIQIPKGRDPLTYFLVEKSPAHCEYFASATAVLLRLANVPSRYVTGFVVEERSPYGDYWIGRNKDAHAWVEAWDSNRGAWVIVEATPSSGVPQGTDSGKLRYFWDYLKFRLQEFQMVIMQDGLVGAGKWLLVRIKNLAILAVSTVPGAIATILLVMFLMRKRLRKIRWTRKTKPDPKVAAMHQLLGKMDNRLKKRNLVRKHNETLHQFIERIRRDGGENIEPFAQWYGKYAAVRYGAMDQPGELEKLRDLAKFS